MIPIQITVVRYVCPFCRSGRSSGKAAVAHIARCWRNPAVRGCKTCKHFEPGGPENFEECDAGVDLSGHHCKVCDVEVEEHGSCPEHPYETITRPGPIVNCDLWEAT